MSTSHLSSPLSARAARVLAELCAADVPVTVVVIGTTTAIQGRVSFAHGGRAAVVTRSPLDGFAQSASGVVLTALWQDRAVSLSGRVREVGPQSVSLELVGDLRGTDPRRHPRMVVPADVEVSVTGATGTLTGRVRDVSERGLSLVIDPAAPCPPVGASVRVSAGPEVGPLDARVCHRTLGVDDAGRVRVGLGVPNGSDARVLLGRDQPGPGATEA